MVGYSSKAYSTESTGGCRERLATVASPLRGGRRRALPEGPAKRDRAAGDQRVRVVETSNAHTPPQRHHLHAQTGVYRAYGRKFVTLPSQDSEGD